MYKSGGFPSLPCQYAALRRLEGNYYELFHHPSRCMARSPVGKTAVPYWGRLGWGGRGGYMSPTPRAGAVCVLFNGGTPFPFERVHKPKVAPYGPSE